MRVLLGKEQKYIESFSSRVIRQFTPPKQNLHRHAAAASRPRRQPLTTFILHPSPFTDVRSHTLLTLPHSRSQPQPPNHIIYLLRSIILLSVYLPKNRHEAINPQHAIFKHKGGNQWISFKNRGGEGGGERS